MNQQAFLEVAYDLIKRDILPSAPPRNKVVLSYGFPSRGARSVAKKTIGECHYSCEKGEGGIEGFDNAIFIHPCQWASPADVLHVLVHEMIHAALPHGAKHNGKFASLALGVGLEGKPAATVAGPALRVKLEGIAREALNESGFPAAPLAPKNLTKISKSRLRLWECECKPVVKVRVASDMFAATCRKCGQDFEKQTTKDGGNE